MAFAVGGAPEEAGLNRSCRVFTFQSKQSRRWTNHDASLGQKYRALLLLSPPHCGGGGRNRATRSAIRAVRSQKSRYVAILSVKARRVRVLSKDRRFFKRR